MNYPLPRSFSINKTQENFSKVVWIYDLWGKLTESKAINKALAIANIKDNLKVLDIGVGTGQLFERILNKNKSGLNFGIDLSPSMIAKASEKFKTLQIKNLLLLGNALFMPYKSESFDYIFCSYVFDLLPQDDFFKLLTEFKRVLKKNSSGIIITMSMGKKWYNRIWFLTAKYFPSILTNCRPVYLKDYLVTAGFNILKQEIISQNTFPSEIILFKK